MGDAMQIINLIKTYHEIGEAGCGFCCLQPFICVTMMPLLYNRFEFYNSQIISIGSKFIMLYHIKWRNGLHQVRPLGGGGGGGGGGGLLEVNTSNAILPRENYGRCHADNLIKTYHEIFEAGCGFCCL